MASGERRREAKGPEASDSVAGRHAVGVRRAVVGVKVAAEAERCSISRVEDMVPSRDSPKDIQKSRVKFGKVQNKYRTT